MGGPLKSLGYMGFGGQDLQAWRTFSQRVLGTESQHRTVAGAGEVLGLRMDECSHRFIISAAAGAPFFGFDVGDAAGLARIRRALQEAGREVFDASRQELAVRRVEQMAWTRDPDGNRLEFYCGLEGAATPFKPDRPIGGFKTGGLGIGHVVLVVDQLERGESFYRDVLGFRISDYVLTPTRRVFMRINARHHSVALSERPGGGIAHIMVEVNAIDDVGRAYDVAQAEYGAGIYSTLGRHSNDHMVSFYVATPAGFPIEYGWGGRMVDESSWKVENLFGPSLWGHDRVGGSAAARAAANEQREFAFRSGIRAPLELRPAPQNEQ
jgi:2,3-dihydroxybiphenyl 1,2-dioxygenase